MPSILGRLFGGGIIPAVEGTLAAPVLQRDVRLPLRTADRFGVTPHRDQGPDWHIVGAKVVEAPTLPTAAWSERWTVASDGTTREYLVVFTPTEQGTDFSIQIPEPSDTTP